MIERKAEGGLDLRCFCGGKICVCEAMGCWSAHCQDCDWKYGGSTLTTTREAAIRPWMEVLARTPQAQTGGGGRESLREAVDRLYALQSGLCQQHCGEAANRGIHTDGCRACIHDLDSIASALLPAGVEPGTGASPDAALAMETMLVLACKELIRRTGNIESQAVRYWWQDMEEGIEGGGPSGPKKALREPSALFNGEEVEMWPSHLGDIIVDARIMDDRYPRIVAHEIPEVIAFLQARSAPNPKGEGPSPNPLPLSGSPGARPMKLGAEIDPDNGFLYVWEGEDKEDDVLYQRPTTRAQAEEIAYRINAFEAPGARECWIVEWPSHPSQICWDREWAEKVRTTNGEINGRMGRIGHFREVEAPGKDRDGEGGK